MLTHVDSQACIQSAGADSVDVSCHDSASAFTEYPSGLAVGMLLTAHNLAFNSAISVVVKTMLVRMLVLTDIESQSDMWFSFSWCLDQHSSAPVV